MSGKELEYDRDNVVDNIHPNLFKFSYQLVMNDVEVAKELHRLSKAKRISREQILATLISNYQILAAA